MTIGEEDQHNFCPVAAALLPDLTCRLVGAARGWNPSSNTCKSQPSCSTRTDAAWSLVRRALIQRLFLVLNVCRLTCPSDVCDHKQVVSSASFTLLPAVVLDTVGLYEEVSH